MLFNKFNYNSIFLEFFFLASLKIYFFIILHYFNENNHNSER